MSNEEKEILKAKIQRKINEKLVESQGHCFVPYTNKDGSFSWQQELDLLLSESNGIREIFVPACNSAGKTIFLAYLITGVLNGTHPICKKFTDKNSIHIHIICEDKGVQKTTLQAKLEEITLGEISSRGFGNREKYKMTSHNEVFSSITCRKTGNYVTFGSLKEGSTGLVGIRPSILLSDEPCSKQIYEELCVRTTEKNALFIMCATVVNNKHGWIIGACKEILESKPKSRKVITAKMIDNPYVTEDAIAHVGEIFGVDSAQYKVRVMGELLLVDGLVLNGFDKCIVPNNYVPCEYEASVNKYRDYIWAESWDFGIGAGDPTLIGFFKCYTNGLIVQEDEVCLYEKTLDEWIDAVLAKRFELDMDYMTDGYRAAGAILDTRTGYEVRKPTICVGDKSYLARKAGVNTASRIKTEFAKRNIFIQPASGDRIELGIPVIQSLVKSKALLVKERCIKCADMAINWVAKVSEKDGKASYNSPYDHYGDILRYLIEKIPNNSFVASIKANESFIQNQSAGTVKERLAQAKKYYNF